MKKEVTGLFKKAKLIVGEHEELTIPCLFNPRTYSIRKNANYNSGNQLGETAALQFTGLSPAELTVSLLFDSYEISGVSKKKEGDVPSITSYTDKLMQLVTIKPSEHQPPQVKFCWGDLEFPGYVTSMTQTFTMFAMSGKPVRAKVDLTIRKSGERKPPLESPDRTKYTTFTEGMSLWMLAYQEYGDCEKWRVIAKANGIMNPLDLKPGQMLKIPALTGEGKENWRNDIWQI